MMDTYHDGHPQGDMKEVFTKSFWQSVKKTYYEALEGSPSADGASQAPAEGDLNPSSTSETPSSPSPSSEQP
jgi:hypothetical protein